MTIQVGDRLPQTTFRVMTPDGPAAKTTDDLFKGRKIVLVAVPGAFTPTCDRNHLPGYVAKANELRAKGFDAIVVTAVADADPPPALREQVRPGGALVCPVRRSDGEYLMRFRDGDEERVVPVRFVPLVASSDDPR